MDLASLHVDSDGGILYACDFEAGSDALVDEQPAVGEAAVPLSPFPAHLIFHSKPGSPNVVFLNFNGEAVINTEWNTSLARTEIPAVAFSTDSDFSTFSDAEQAAIKNIWLRMAEDFAPFDVDVTTERPAVFGTRTAMALITRSTDANGQPNPSSTAGGVAYVNVFSISSFARYRPAWIYFNNLGNNESYIAEAASHEIGHNMGLSHDGKTDGSAYYTGHGSGDISWGPIMGTGYQRNVSQWSKGEYYLANNLQDDLVVMAGKMNYQPDDHADTVASATPLVLTGGSNILSTTPWADPANTNRANKGRLGRNTDIDVFSFDTGAGIVTLAVKPWIMPSGYRGGNLDVLVELFDESGTRVATNNPALLTTAQIQATLEAGRYYLHVKACGAGNPLISAPTGYTSYGSLGQYFISGSVVAGAAPPPSVVLYSADMDANPGWALEPLWQYGTPSAPGGPTAGPTGPFVIGYNLSGNYENNLVPKYATTPAIDTTGNNMLSLRFRRWLGVKPGDTATIQVSTNNSTWVTVWSTNGTAADGAWVDSRIDLPAGLAGSDQLRLRWGLQSGQSQNDIGWNLDDVELIGNADPPPRVTLQVGVNDPAWGMVSVTNGSFPKGTQIAISATPAPYYQFTEWTGDATGVSSNLTLELQSNTQVTAHFRDICTSTYAVPQVWLASNGFLDFEDDVLRIGANGLALWQSYVAGLDPNDPESRFVISGRPAAGGGSGFTLNWQTIPDRVYTVYVGTNLAAPFWPLPGASNLSPAEPQFTDSVPHSDRQRFYRVGVSRP